jgi:hypothetical protein
MNARKNIASNVARALTLFGVLALLASAVQALRPPPPGMPPVISQGDLFRLLALLAAGVAMIAGAIALDRWARRQEDEPPPGFDVVVRLKDDDTEKRRQDVGHGWGTDEHR